MKRICLIILSVFFILNTYSQTGRNSIAEKSILGNTIGKNDNLNRKFPQKDIYRNISRDFFGHLQYDNNNKKASLKKDVFDAWIYSDNRNNEIKFSKEYWVDILQDFRQDETKIFAWMINLYDGLSGYKEEYKTDIFGYQQYESNQRGKASLKKDVFDAWIYTDSRNNEINFSKEYWADIMGDFDRNERRAFIWLINTSANLSSYKEKYKIDVFGYQQYENNQREKASLKKDVFDNMIYEDSKGTKIQFAENQWKKQLRKHHSDKKIFMNLIQCYLFSD